VSILVQRGSDCPLGLDHIVASHHERPENPRVADFARMARVAAQRKGLSAKVTVMRAGDVLEL
jgi:hypothetical protein